MPTSPTLADFFRAALSAHADDLSRGQYASKALSHMHPGISAAITGTAADPFHFDERMPEFLAQVAVLWQRADAFEPELSLTTCASCGNDPRPSEVIVREDRDEWPSAEDEPVGANREFIARWADPEFGEVRIRTRGGELTFMDSMGQIPDGHHLEILARRVGSLGGFLNATKAATASVGAGSLLTIPFDQEGAVADLLCGLAESVVRLRENDPDDFDVDGEVRAAIIDVAALLRIILGRSTS